MIINQIALVFMSLVFFDKILQIGIFGDDNLKYDDLAIEAVAVGTSSIGTFLTVFHKISKHVIKLLIATYPYVKAFCIKVYAIIVKERKMLANSIKK